MSEEHLTRAVAIEQGFVNDGCSFVPDFDIGYCCTTHDYLYRRGGWKGSRAEADKLFRDMILRHGQEKGTPLRYVALAWTYWLGVRLFGWIVFRSKEIVILK